MTGARAKRTPAKRPSLPRKGRNLGTVAKPPLAAHLEDAARQPDALLRAVSAEQAGGDLLVAAEAVLDPTTTAAWTMRQLVRKEDGSGPSITALSYALERQVEAIKKGDLSGPEAMLYAQAQTLDQIFGRLTRIAVEQLNGGGMMGMVDLAMRLGLKAQSQCRATLETLAAVKNPPIVYAKQANIANGPQQVNNGVDPRVQGNGSPPTKLLEQVDGQRLDAGPASSAGNPGSTLETVGAVNGAAER